MKTMMMCVVMMLAAVTFAAVTFAEPATKFETFESADGSITIRQTYNIGAVPCRFGKAGVELIKIARAETGESIYALRIQFTDDRGIDRISILDEDEIGSAAKAIAYIQRNKAKIATDANTYTEVNYRSRSGFRVGFYTDPKDKKIVPFMRVGTQAVFIESVEKLEEHVATALAKVKELKAAK